MVSANRPNISNILKSFANNRERYRSPYNEKEARENTRHLVMLFLTGSYILLLAGYSASLVFVYYGGNMEAGKLILEAAKEILGFLTPIFTITIGFYFATKSLE